MRAFYKEHGWVSIRDVIPLGHLAALVAEIEHIFNPDGRFATVDEAILDLDANDKERLYHLHMGANKLLSLRKVNEVLMDLLRDLNESNNPVFEISIGFLLGLPRDTRLAYDFHQESNFMKGFDEISNFHFPLRHVSDVENGTMSVLDGSHALGSLPFRKSRASSDSFTDLVPIDIDALKAEYEEVFCRLEPGDVTIFHKDCIHKSNFNKSDLCRLVGVSRLTQRYNFEFKRQTSEEL